MAAAAAAIVVITRGWGGGAVGGAELAVVVVVAAAAAVVVAIVVVVAAAAETVMRIMLTMIMMFPGDISYPSVFNTMTLNNSNCHSNRTHYTQHPTISREVRRSERTDTDSKNY